MCARDKYYNSRLRGEWIQTGRRARGRSRIGHKILLNTLWRSSLSWGRRLEGDQCGLQGFQHHTGYSSITQVIYLLFSPAALFECAAPSPGQKLVFSSSLRGCRTHNRNNQADRSMCTPIPPDHPKPRVLLLLLRKSQQEIHYFPAWLSGAAFKADFKNQQINLEQRHW